MERQLDHAVSFSSSGHFGTDAIGGHLALSFKIEYRGHESTRHAQVPELARVVAEKKVARW